MIQVPSDFPLVDNEPSLHEIAERLEGAELVAIDTEFIRERTYYPELCLLQIATDETVVAIDCLAPISLQPLFESLLGSRSSWVLHSARQDLEVLCQRSGHLPMRLVDTQLASALLGFPLQIGLQGMLAEILGVTIDKEHTRADWSRRPLADALLRYALDDVRHLLPAWHELEARLIDAGRLAWFEEDCARLLATPLEPDAATIFERTKGAGNLKGRQRSAALALVGWRESRAQQRNRPRRWPRLRAPRVLRSERRPISQCEG